MFLARLFILSLLLTLTSCSPLYVLKASYTEARILASREDIESTLKADKELDDILKQKLALILSVKKFSEKIGMTPRGSYTTYSTIKDLPPTYVITAVESHALKPVTWWYPFVGSIPYKGYFDKEEALEEANTLKENELDVSLRESIAYSTLGWFDDPVLQTVLKEDPSNIVITVFHEIMHSTLWIQNHPDFNETMAEAVGLLAGLEYSKAHHPEMKDSILKRIQYECEMSYQYEDTYIELENLFSKKLDKNEANLQKQKIYENLTREIIKARKDILNLESQFNDKYKFNNASFLSSYIYLKELHVFLSIFLGSEESTLTLVNKLKSIDSNDPYSNLKNLLSNDMVSSLNKPINICDKFLK